MAQNITLLGASYSDVPSVVLPKTGGGTARFDDASVTTATAVDVASGKIFLANDGTITTGTASGGGGASNVVTGTFKGTTTGAAMDVTLNYSGSGYPIAVLIYPSEGTYNSSGSFYNLIQRYAYNTYLLVKNEPNTVPTYDGGGTGVNTNNKALLVGRYKNSTTNATTYTQTGSTNNSVYNDTDATSSNTTVLRVRSKTKLSVYIISSGSNYGFAANIEYKYWVIYSS